MPVCFSGQRLVVLSGSGMTAAVSPGEEFPASNRLVLPDPCLVVLVGPAGCGKSTFAQRHFRPEEVLSSDFFRKLIANEETDQSTSREAFALLHLVLSKRLARRLLTVVDATNVQAQAQRPLLELADIYQLSAVALVFALPLDLCLERNRQRARVVPEYVVAGQLEQLHQLVPHMQSERRFRAVHLFTTAEQVDRVQLVRDFMPAERDRDLGPFDLIGDVHGCFEELRNLLSLLGYQVQESVGSAGQPEYQVQPPAGRRAVFVGDLVDRGPQVVGVLRLVMHLVETGAGLCVIGNHDDKLRRYLAGRPVRLTRLLQETLAQLEQEPADFRERVRVFLERLPSHYVLDRGRLVVAHAGLPEEYHGRVGPEVRDFALYGDVTGETDEYGLPVRRDWAARYRGRAYVVYGHTPVAQPQWVHHTINIDTGCVFGGRLTALRYPELELVSVPAARRYAEPLRPF
jgi:protein phosphatase